MFQTQTTATASKAAFYRELHQQLAGLLNGETDADDRAGMERVAAIYIAAGC